MQGSKCNCCGKPADFLPGLCNECCNKGHSGSRISCHGCNRESDAIKARESAAAKTKTP